jgi:Ca-activated chloride channel homolog
MRNRPVPALAARLTALGLLLLLATGAVFGGIERGNRHFRNGEYESAVEAYRSVLGTRADGPVLRYNLGTALLRLGRYEEAGQYLNEALDAIGPDRRGLVHYNLGQRFLEDARAAEDPTAAATLYDGAVEAYREALRLRPGDAHAKWNYELALRERDDLELPGPPEEDPDGDPDDEAEGDGEGGGMGSPGMGDRPPRPGANGEQGPMSREEAERILSAIEQDERRLLQDRLREGRRDAPVERDW